MIRQWTVTMLNKDDFFKPQPRQFKDVEVPCLGGSVRVRKMNAKEKAIFETSLNDKDGKRSQKKLRDFRQLLAIATVCDGDDLMFTEADIERLGALDFDVLDAIADAALELNFKVKPLGNSQPLPTGSPSSDGASDISPSPQGDLIGSGT